MNLKISEGALVREPSDRWTVADASETYDVARWGKGYFSVNPQGHVLVHPTKEPERSIDLKELVDRGILVRLHKTGRGTRYAAIKAQNPQ